MGLLLISGITDVLYGLISRHFKRDFLPISVQAVKRDVQDALRLRRLSAPGAGF